MTVKQTTVACTTILLAAVFALPCQAQGNPGDSDEARIADLVTASHMLANEGILDSFGHVSTRSTQNPERFFMPRPGAGARHPRRHRRGRPRLQTRRPQCAPVERRTLHPLPGLQGSARCAVGD